MNDMKFKKGDKVLVINPSYDAPDTIVYRHAEVASFGAKQTTLKNEDGAMFEKAIPIRQLNTTNAFNGFWLFQADTDPQAAGMDVARQVLENWHSRGKHTSCTLDDVKVIPFPKF